MRTSKEKFFTTQWNFLFVFVFFSTFFLQSCGSDYKDLSNDSGRQILIDQANEYLTSGQCQSAIDVLRPLYESIYVNDEVRMVYASAYACKGGFNFVNLVWSLKDISGADIWTPIVKSNYSSSSDDQKIVNLKIAASILRATSDNTDDYSGSARPADANVYMIFLQAQLIALTISQNTMGAANSTTGRQGGSMVGDGSSTDKCTIQVAAATIADCLIYASSGTAIDKVNSSITTVCGGPCPTNKNPSVCGANEQLQGTALITAIDSQWE